MGIRTLGALPFQVELSSPTMRTVQGTKTKKNTYLKSIVTKKKYRIISPIFLVESYQKTFTKYGTDSEKFNNKLLSEINRLIQQ